MFKKLSFNYEFKVYLSTQVFKMIIYHIMISNLNFSLEFTPKKNPIRVLILQVYKFKF